MSWTYILDGKGFTEGFPSLPRSSDTFFSSLSDDMIHTKLDLVLKHSRRFVNIDNDNIFLSEAKKLAQVFNPFILELDNSTRLRGNLDFVKSDCIHPRFGNNLELFTISNPFSNAKPIFLYAEKGKIKKAGTFGETYVKNLALNPVTKILEAKFDDFYEENISVKIPLTIQDITDFDEFFTRGLALRSNTTTIPIGNSKEVSSLQKLWMPSVSGESVKGQIEGINTYSLVSVTDSGSLVKESMDFLIDYFQPGTNKGRNCFSKVDFDIQKVSQLKYLLDEDQRHLLRGKFLRGFRANVGTVISRVNKKETQSCIYSLSSSRNTDYVNILDGLDVPTNLRSSIRRERLFAGNLRFYLLSLKSIPVKYKVADIKDHPAEDLRMAQAFAKLSPYLLDSNDDEVLVPCELRDSYLRSVSLFRKNNSNLTKDYIEDHHLL